MRKMSSRNSLLTHLLPARVRCRESHFQYNLNPARCQPRTVSGWTRINACFHPGQSRHNITQNNLSEAATGAADAVLSRQQAVAGGPDFPEANRGGNEKNEELEKIISSAGGA